MADKADSPTVDTRAELAKKVLTETDLNKAAELLRSDPELLKEFESMDDKAFSDKYSPATAAPEVPGTPAADSVAPEATPEEIVEAKFSKKLLRTYDSVEAMSEGSAKKDEVIDFFKTKRVPELENENISLKRQLEEYKSRQAAVAKTPAPTPEPQPESTIPSINVDEIGDLFDDGNQKKVKDILKTIPSIIEQNNKLKAKLAMVEETASQAANTLKGADDKRHAEQEAAAAESEFEAIKKSSNGVFSSVRPVSAITADYFKFLEDGSRLLGHSGQIRNPDGSFTEGAQQAFGLYFDEAKGAEFRSKLQASKVVFPKDYDDIVVYENVDNIRKSRSAYDAASGKNKPLPWREALAIYSANNGLFERREMEAKRKGAESYEKAIANRKGFAPNVPAGAGKPAELVQDMNAIGRMVESYESAKRAGKDVKDLKEQLRVTLLNHGITSVEVDDMLK